MAETRVEDSHPFNANSDPAFHFNADPDSDFHFNADPDPASKLMRIHADLDSQAWWKLF
jgi:hypothetical protein